jgi:hypothetical protein
MPFEVAQPKSYGTRPAVPPAGVTVSAHRTPKRDGYYLVFEIGAELGERLALADGERVEVAWGQGSDTGKLRVRKAPAGARGFRVRQRRRGHLAIAVSVLPDWIHDSPSARGLKVGHEVLPDRERQRTDPKASVAFLTLPGALVARHRAA